MIFLEILVYFLQLLLTLIYWHTLKDKKCSCHSIIICQVEECTNFDSNKGKIIGLFQKRTSSDIISQFAVITRIPQVNGV